MESLAKKMTAHDVSFSDLFPDPLLERGGAKTFTWIDIEFNSSLWTSKIWTLAHYQHLRISKIMGLHMPGPLLDGMHGQKTHHSDFNWSNSSNLSTVQLLQLRLKPLQLVYPHPNQLRQLMMRWLSLRYFLGKYISIHFLPDSSYL